MQLIDSQQTIISTPSTHSLPIPNSPHCYSLIDFIFERIEIVCWRVGICFVSNHWRLIHSWLIDSQAPSRPSHCCASNLSLIEPLFVCFPEFSGTIFDRYTPQPRPNPCVLAPQSDLYFRSEKRHSALVRHWRGIVAFCARCCLGIGIGIEVLSVALRGYCCESCRWANSWLACLLACLLVEAGDGE